MRKALGFLTVVGGAHAPTREALAWFPVVGALIGLAVGSVWWGAAQLWSPLVAAALAIAADLIITGMLHADGLADAADGLLPHLSRERRLEVMREPTIGAFGVAAIGVVLLVRFAALASAEPQPLAIAGVWCASRTLMAITMLRVPYARDRGLASSFRDEARPGGAATIAAFGGALAGALLALGSGTRGLVALVACFAGGLVVVALSQRRIGGFTGDVLGAAGVVGETAALLVLAVR